MWNAPKNSSLATIPGEMVGAVILIILLAASHIIPMLLRWCVG
jgi:hypothetical protein